MEIDTAHFKTLLENEKKLLEDQLGQHGRMIDKESGDWVAKAPEPADGEEDPNVQADRIETFENSIATLSELEARYAEVLAALKRIEDGTYGKCVVSGNLIETDRLEANPAARTCIEHIDQ